MSDLNFMEKLLDGVDVEWNSIGSLIKRVREKGKNDKDVKTVYSVSNMRGLVKAEEFRNNTIHSEDTSNYTLVRKGMFAYNPARLNIGSIAYLSTELSGLVSPMYVVFDIDKSKIIQEYLFIFIKSEYCNNRINSLTESGARFRFDFNRWDLIEIPIPPLNIQKKIVSILDKFTELTVELTAELTARKKQYSYYRDKLLTFDEEEVEFKQLGEVADVGVGNKPEVIHETLREFEYINAGTTNSGYCDYFNCEGDTVTTPSRGQGGIGFFGYQSNNFWLGPLCYKIKAKTTVKVLSKYLYYFLEANNYLILELKKEGGVPAVNRSDLIKLNIPIPPLKEQERIVNILDKFDTLTNSISEGLPKEIKLRQQQYEYYRDLLLTFSKEEK